MRNFTPALACAIALVAGANTATAASTGDTYIGIGYSQLTYSEDGFPDFNPSLLAGRVGYYMNKNFSVEGRVGIGIGDDSNNVSVFIPGVGVVNANVDVEVDTLIGVYAVGHLPASDMLDLYGFVGFNRADITATATAGGTSFSYSDDDSDIALGIGAEFQLNKRSAINIEYGNFYDDQGVSVDALSIGYTMNL